jgi:S-adenosylmethionine decarboxylase
MFGPHLIVDCYKCKKEKIGDVEFIKKFLENLPAELGLHKISEASVKFYNVPTPGISGFILISESHITVHTFIEEGFAAVDIFSCKEFDLEKATNLVVNAFEPEKFEKKFITRGKHYPLEVRKAIQLNMKERMKKA